MKREQEEVVLGPQSPLPWLDELLPSACDGAWAPDNIFNFDGNTTARQASWVNARVQRADFKVCIKMVSSHAWGGHCCVLNRVRATLLTTPLGSV